MRLGGALPIVLSGLAVVAGCIDPSVSDGPVGSIGELQGGRLVSPYEGRQVEIEGVVTLVLRNESGFYLQDPNGDGDPGTSDGVYVDVTDGLKAPPAGSAVRVRGTVLERVFGVSLSRTEISESSFEVVASDIALPEAVVIERVPESSIPEAIAFWSAMEAMRVRFGGGVVVGPTNRFGEFGVVLQVQAKPGSGFDTATSRLFVRALDAMGNVDYNPERLLVDDETHRRMTVLPGDRIVDFVGVVDYAFGTYRLQPETMSVERGGSVDTASEPRVSEPGSYVSVASLNVENLFDLVDDPATDDGSSTPSESSLETKLLKLSRGIAVSLRAPEILLLQEVENQSVADELARRTNHRLDGATSYRARSWPASDGRGIENAVIWDRHRVRLIEAHLLDGPDVEAAFGAGARSPGREPLVARFAIGAQTLVTVNNHFKSKGGDDPLWGSRQPPKRSTESQRKAQARAVRAAVDAWLAADPDALVLVAGDLNDFPFPEPGEGSDHPIGILEGRETLAPFENLIHHLDTPASTYIYQGNSQVLDHFLVSPALARHVVGFEILAINAGYPASWAGDRRKPYRFSDHDPLLARFSLKTAPSARSIRRHRDSRSIQVFP